MTLRKAAANRLLAVTHLFHEGNDKALCGYALSDSFKVKPDWTEPTCSPCLTALDRFEEARA